MMSLMVEKFYPWLYKIINEVEGITLDNLDSLNIKNAFSEKILEKTGYNDIYYCENVVYHHYLKFFAIFIDKKEIHYCEFDSSYCFKNNNGDLKKGKALSLRDQLLSLKMKSQFIVEIKFYDKNINKKGKKLRSITIYDMRKINFCNYYKELMKKSSENKKI